MGNSWISSGGVEVTIEPFSSNGWKFTRLTMTEVLGGKIAEGKISFLSTGSEKSLELVTGEGMVNYVQISLKKEKGVSYNIKGFITSRNWVLNSLDIEFICVPDKSFLTEPQILTQSDITRALKILWKWDNIDIRCKSDINNNIPLQQLGESNYNLCKKLAYSFKKNSIFTFGLEGFMIKDMIGIDSLGNKEPNIKVLGDGQVNQTSGYNFNYNYKLYKEASDPWEEEGYSENRQSPNLSSLTIDQDYYLVSRSHWNLLSNYVHNKNLMESKLFTSFNIVTPDTLPDFKIGDTILYERSTDNQKRSFNTFLVSKMTFFISSEEDKDENGLGFSVTSTLKGIQEDGNFMPKDETRYNS